MLTALLVILIILWFLGYISVGVPGLEFFDVALFTINNQTISLWDLLIFLVIVSLVGILPTPLRQIVGVILILWILSTLGILAIGGLSSILVIAIIIGLIVSLFT